MQQTVTRLTAGAQCALLHKFHPALDQQLAAVVQDGAAGRAEVAAADGGAIRHVFGEGEAGPSPAAARASLKVERASTKVCRFACSGVPAGLCPAGLRPRH